MSKRKTPVLRFKGFHNDWEQRKLGDYGSVKMNKRIFKNQTSPNGDIPFYKIGTFGKKADSFISKKLYEKYKVKYPYPKIGDLLISASGSIGRIIEYKGKKAYFQDSNIVWLSHNSKLLNIYLKQYYQRINWNNIEGTTIKRLYNKDILTTHISVPNIKEQKRIGNLLNLVDNLLVLQKRKYEELKLIKKFLLQNMFADKVPYPNLRFNNFTSEWKLQYLGKLFRRNNERNKKNIFKIDHTITVSKMKFNINGNGAAPTSICTYKVLRTGDVAFEGNRHTKYPFGQLIINDIGDGIMSPRFASIRPKYKLNISYWKYFLHYEPLVHNILVMSTKSGTLMNELVYSDLFKQNIFLPENSEQIKIGKILNIIDYKINLQKRYILKLKSIKNFLLQNMFV